MSAEDNGRFQSNPCLELSIKRLVAYHDGKDGKLNMESGRMQLDPAPAHRTQVENQPDYNSVFN